ncbi:MAG: hypothetical protein DRG78_03235 [Epsilonproteobacteria bacterium]|nr:MAG: hypothetical protein DRG78_03235 [Campylobacterota bacterium]
MKKLIIFLLFIGSLYATSDFQSNKTCKGCHPKIYAEYTSSAHKKSSIFEDSIHKAVWDMHPSKAKNKYTCNECHSPADTRITKALADEKNAVPIKNAAQVDEAVSCVYCHSIKNIEEHANKVNDKNILVNNDKKRPTLFAASKEKRGTKVNYETKTSFMGMFKSTTGSPYHDIDYSNKTFYTGKMCMGCHARFENEHNMDICKIEIDGAKNEEQNCITCHMPQVKGSATTIVISKTHTFHGFAGTKNKPKMLAKYLDFNFVTTNSGFDISLTNQASHKLLVHTFRLAKLNIRIQRGTKTTKLKSESFVRTLGKDGKPTLPWLATEVVKDNMLKAGETRTIKYDTAVKSGDIVEVEFGYYLVDPQLHKELNLENNEEATKFTILKTKFFTVK